MYAPQLETEKESGTTNGKGGVGGGPRVARKLAGGCDITNRCYILEVCLQAWKLEN